MEGAKVVPVEHIAVKLVPWIHADCWWGLLHLADLLTSLTHGG